MLACKDGFVQLNALVISCRTEATPCLPINGAIESQSRVAHRTVAFMKLRLARSMVDELSPAVGITMFACIIRASNYIKTITLRMLTNIWGQNTMPLIRKGETQIDPARIRDRGCWCS